MIEKTQYRFKRIANMEEGSMKLQLLYHGNIICPPKWRALPYQDPYVRVFYHQGGTAYYLLDGEKVFLAKNHLYIFPTFSKCEVRHQSSDPLHLLFFRCELSAVLEGNVISLDLQQASHRMLVDLLLQYVTADTAVLEALLTSLFELLLYEGVLQQYRAERFAKVIQFIQENYAQPLSNQMLSDQISYHKNYFVKIFKQNTGVSPHKYLQMVRLHKAKALLLQGASVAQASVQCGFSSPDQLSRDFKAFFHQNASEMKKQKTIDFITF